MTGVTPNGIRYPDGASKAKNLGPELKQMAEDIDAFIDSQTASTLGAVKCVHREGSAWVWDGPITMTATHYVLPDHTGAPVVRPTPFPTPLATPAFDW